MKKVIEGKTYDTETARKICDLACNCYPSDFGYHETKLYRTPKGRYFLAGHGNAASLWASRVSNSSGPGRGVRPVSNAEALEYAEEAGVSAEDLQAAGFALEEA